MLRRSVVIPARSGMPRMILMQFDSDSPYPGQFGCVLDELPGLVNRPAKRSEVDRGLEIDNSSEQQGDPDAIKTLFACPLVPTTYAGASLDGALGGTLSSPRIVTVHLSLAPGSYSTAPITITDANETFSLSPTSADGGQMLSTPSSCIGALSITIPAQPLATGRIQIGVSGSSFIGVWPIRVRRPTAEEAANVAVDILGDLLRDQSDPKLRAKASAIFQRQALAAMAVEALEMKAPR